MRPNWSHIFLGHFGGEKKLEEERKRRRRGRREERYGIMTLSLDTCLDLLWFLYGF